MTKRAPKWLMVLATLLAGCALRPAPQADEMAAIAARMDDLSKAIVGADKPALEAIAWPELSFGHANGRVESHSQFVSALGERRSVIPRFELSKVTTQHVADLAIARGILTGTYMAAGKPVGFQLGFVMVWQKRGGEWRLLAHQAHKR